MKRPDKMRYQNLLPTIDDRSEISGRKVSKKERKQKQKKTHRTQNPIRRLESKETSRTLHDVA